MTPRHGRTLAVAYAVYLAAVLVVAALVVVPLVTAARVASERAELVEVGATR